MDEEKREWHVGVVLGGKRDLKAAAKKIRAHVRVRNATVRLTGLGTGQAVAEQWEKRLGSCTHSHTRLEADPVACEPRLS